MLESQGRRVRRDMAVTILIMMRWPCPHCPILIITQPSGQMLIFSFYSWGNRFREMRWFVHGHRANKWQLLAWNRMAGPQSPRLWPLCWKVIWPLAALWPPLPCPYLWRKPYLLHQRLECSISWIVCVFAATPPGSGSGKRQEGREATHSQGLYILILSNSDKPWSNILSPVVTPTLPSGEHLAVPCSNCPLPALLRLHFSLKAKVKPHRPASNHASNPWPSVWPWASYEVGNLFKPLWLM